MLQGLIIALTVATVPLARGDLRRLADVRLRAPWLALTALAIQILIITIVPEGPKTLYAAIHLGTYFLMGAFVIANRHIPGVWLIALGGALNFAAIVANGGVMPASPEAVQAAGVLLGPGEFENSIPLPDPKLLFLGDIFAAPSFLPLRNVYSIGDVLLTLGGAVALHRLCRSKLAWPS